MTLLEWIKANAKEGVDFKEAESLIKDLDPLKNLATVEDTLSFMKRNDNFMKALDSETSSRVNSAIEKFKEKQLPGLLKEESEKVRSEINPKETPEQKEIRELKEWKSAQIKEKNDYVLKEKLRDKAKELADEQSVPYDPLRAERLFVYGDEAFNVLADEVGYFKTAIDKQLDAKLKGQFNSTMPKGGSNIGIESMTDAQLNRAAIENPAQKDAILQEVKRRLMPST